MPVKVEKTYDLPCYVCARTFNCTRFEITTVIDPPQPLCKSCRSSFDQCPRVKATLTRFYGQCGELPGWNKALRTFVEAVESGRIPLQHWGRVWGFRPWIQYPAGLKDAHPARCLCGACECDKLEMAKSKRALSGEMVQLVAKVDAAAFSTYFPEDCDAT